MQEIRIKLDFSHGPIWKEKYNPETGIWSTGVSVIDNDRALSVLNEEAEREYVSLYSIDDEGGIMFDDKEFEHKKADLKSLVQTIILRLTSINDGTYMVINEEANWIL